MSKEYLFQAKHKSATGTIFLHIVNTNDGSDRFADIGRPILNPRFAETSIYGIVDKKLVRLDPRSWTMTVVGPIHHVDGISSLALVEMAANEYLLAGRYQSQSVLYAMSLTDGKQRRVRARSVGVGGVKVGKLNEPLYTYGIEACTGIAGYDPKSGTAFLAHLRPDDEGALEVLQSIDRIVREEGANGIRDLQVSVVGSRYAQLNGRWKSKNLHDIYSALVNTYGIPLDRIDKHHAGRVYSIIIDERGVQVR